MDFKLTSTRSRAAGFSLAETMLALAATTMLMGTFGIFSLYTSKNIASAANYVDLETESRMALDRMSQDLRQVNGVTSCTTNEIVLADYDGTSLSFTFDSNTHTLTRTKGVTSKILLSDCESLGFGMFQRNPVAGSYDVYPAADTSTCKLVSVQWVCARKTLGNIRNSESSQTAKIVIRKQ